MKAIITAIFIIFLLFPLYAHGADEISKVSVTGKSEITLPPEYAIIRLEVTHVRKTMDASHSELTRTLFKIVKRLKVVGLKSEDMKKSLVLQGEENKWENDSWVHKGYYSKCYMNLYVNDINQITSVYKKLAMLESVSIISNEYKRRDEFEVRQEQFKKALLAARKKAEHMAQTLGAKIGKVHSIREVSSDSFFQASAYSNSVGLMAQDGLMSSDGGAGYGDVKISATVEVEFKLK